MGKIQEKPQKMPGEAHPRSKSTECIACLGNSPPPHHPHTPAPFPRGKSLCHSRFRSGSLPVPARPFLLLSKTGKIHVACLFNILLLDSILSPRVHPLARAASDRAREGREPGREGRRPDTNSGAGASTGLTTAGEGRM